MKIINYYKKKNMERYFEKYITISKNDITQIIKQNGRLLSNNENSDNNNGNNENNFYINDPLPLSSQTPSSFESLESSHSLSMRPIHARVNFSTECKNNRKTNLNKFPFVKSEGINNYNNNIK